VSARSIVATERRDVAEKGVWILFNIYRLLLSTKDSTQLPIELALPLLQEACLLLKSPTIIKGCLGNLEESSRRNILAWEADKEGLIYSKKISKEFVGLSGKMETLLNIELLYLHKYVSDILNEYDKELWI
jgi:hypothetical protein